MAFSGQVFNPPNLASFQSRRCYFAGAAAGAGADEAAGAGAALPEVAAAWAAGTAAAWGWALGLIQQA